MALALFYWWIDVKKHHRRLEFFTIVGMNSIFIYLFFSIAGAYFFNGYVNALTTGLLSLARIGGIVAAVASSFVIFALEWGLCYFLYRKRIFFRL